MFTSRAEFRILLRQDNADLRLTETGHRIGLASDERLEKMLDKKNDVKRLLNDLKLKKVRPEAINHGLEELNTATIKEKISVVQLLKRPQLGMEDLINLDEELGAYLKTFQREVLEQAEIMIKYDSYIDKEQKLAERLENLENFHIPADFDYAKINSLSTEARQKLGKIKPATIGQASRISGVSPSDISIVMIYLGR